PPAGHAWSGALGLSDDRETTVGFARRGPEDHHVPIRWIAAGPELLPGTPVTTVSATVNGVSADGRVLVGGALFEEELVGFAWTATSGYRLLRGASPDIIADARCVSADGRIAGGLALDPTQATVWHLATGGHQRLGSL